MAESGVEIVIDERFCGPPRSGNGGYVCGGVAAHHGGDVAVRLKAPPPIGRALVLESSDGTTRLRDGDAVIAEARPLASTDPLHSLAVPAAPTFEAAERASQRYSGFIEHNFPTCFVCGPKRAPGDGLRIFPGALEGVDGVIAAPWVPDASLADSDGRVRSEFVWAALDCPGAFTRFPLPKGTALVLGELAVCLSGPVTSGERCVLAAWSLGDDGRRRHAATVLYGGDGRVAARSRAVWVEVSAEVWR